MPLSTVFEASLPHTIATVAANALVATAVESNWSSASIVDDWQQRPQVSEPIPGYLPIAIELGYFARAPTFLNFFNYRLIKELNEPTSV